MVAGHRATTLPFASLLLVACAPEFDEAPWLVSEARVIALSSQPAETTPGESADHRAWIAGPGGLLDAASVSLAFCTTPKPPAENNIVAPACLEASSAPFAQNRVTARAVTPFDACQRFGPDPPPGNLRPRDPDITGGYYVPITILGVGLPAVGLHRIRCNLARALPEVSAAYRQSPRNTNPTLSSLRVGTASVSPIRVAAGASVDLEAEWAEGTAERFPKLDLTTQRLADICENLTVSWFITNGRLDTQKTGRACAEATSSTNRFLAPAEAGTVHLFVVLRDDRGGADVRSLQILIER